MPNLNDRPVPPLCTASCRHAGLGDRDPKMPQKAAQTITWLFTLQETMVAPCKLMVQVVLLPLSIGTTGTEAAIFVIPPFQPTVFTTPDGEAI